MAYANGKYINFVDSDDWLELDALEKLHNLATKNDSDIVVCDYYEIYNNDKIKKNGLQNFSENININYILSNPSPWNKLIKLELLKNNNINFLENYIYEDLATMPILGCYANNIAYIKEPLYNYVIRTGSTMRQSIYNKKIESIFIAIEHLDKQFKNRNFSETYKQELEFLNIYNLLYAASGRFLEYEEGKQNLTKIIKTIKNNYPNWKKNRYYKQQNTIFKVTCNIFYYNYFTFLYNWIRKILKKL